MTPSGRKNRKEPAAHRGRRFLDLREESAWFVLMLRIVARPGPLHPSGRAGTAPPGGFRCGGAGSPSLHGAQTAPATRADLLGDFWKIRRIATPVTSVTYFAMTLLFEGWGGTPLRHFTPTPPEGGLAAAVVWAGRRRLPLIGSRGAVEPTKAGVWHYSAEMR